MSKLGKESRSNICVLV